MKPDTKQGDRPVIAEKVALIKTPMTEKIPGKVAGIKLDNVPKEKTEGDTVELLEKKTKLNKDKLKTVMKESGKLNTTFRVTNGIEPKEIMTTIYKIDYKIAKEKIHTELLKILEKIPRAKKTVNLTNPS